MKRLSSVLSAACFAFAGLALASCAGSVDVTAHDRASRAVASVDASYAAAVNAMSTYAELPRLGTPACAAVTVGSVKPCSDQAIVDRAIDAATRGDKLLDAAWAGVAACPVNADSCDLSAVEGAATAAVNELIGILTSAGVAIKGDA